MKAHKHDNTRQALRNHTLNVTRTETILAILHIKPTVVLMGATSIFPNSNNYKEIKAIIFGDGTHKNTKGSL